MFRRTVGRLNGRTQTALRLPWAAAIPVVAPVAVAAAAAAAAAGG
jgi:hypothetical protein